MFNCCWTAFLVSMTVGNSSNRTLHIICGSLSLASWSIQHTIKVFGLPFQDSLFICEKSASICTEQCGDPRAFWTINDFQCIMTS